MSNNHHRRHDSVPKRAMAAARLSNLSHGGDRHRKKDKLRNLNLIPTRELADAFGISKGTIDFAITLLRDAAPEEPSRGSAVRVRHRPPRLDRAIA
jgi:hypothetical protein